MEGEIVQILKSILESVQSSTFSECLDILSVGFSGIAILECVSKFILTEIMQVIYECRQGKQSPGTCVPACRSEWRRDETL